MWAAQNTGAKRILVLVPSLTLLSQLLQTFRDDASWADWRALAVCSDESVADEDAVAVDLSEISCPVTRSPVEVEAFMSAEYEGVRVVFSTYHSAHLTSGCRFELGIFDEAHKTSGERGKPFGLALSDSNIKITRRLFFTATPRVTMRNENDAWKTVHSMDDPEVYGPVFFELSFRDAVRRGIVCDYKIVISEVAGNPDLDHRLAAHVALTKAMILYDVTKVFTFHSSVEAASNFVGSRDGGFPDSTALLHVCGRQPSSVRRKLMDKFETSKTAVMSNAKCLTEGVDVPAVGMVAFIHPKRAVIEIVQAAGRACRLSEGKKFGLIFLPLFRDVNANETIEAATERSQFRNVLDVLQAMATQDDILRDYLARMREVRLLGDENAFEALPNVDFILSDHTETHSSLTAQQLRHLVSVALIHGMGGSRDTDAKKSLLMKMARAGLPRPKYAVEKERPLWTALQTYTRAKVHDKQGIDPEFNRQIREAAPHWFVNSGHIKARLLAMASRGEPRPKDSNAVSKEEKKLCTRLKDYMKRDPEFLQELARINPVWLDKSSVHNKRELLEMARSGAQMPNKRGKTPEERRWGALLRNYCCPVSQSYDQAFRFELEALGWVVFKGKRQAQEEKAA